MYTEKPDYDKLPDEFEQESTTKLERALTKINQAANEDRIKLETLKNCYITLAKSYHTILCVTSHEMKDHRKEWNLCDEGACPSNLEVLVKLELI